MKSLRSCWSLVPIRSCSSSNQKSCSQFVKPLSDAYPPLPCRCCKGYGEMACEQCEGRGTLALGGYHRKNPVDMARVVGSKWTAMERTFGWRHYEARAKQRMSDKEWFVQMVATCDTTTQLWVNAQNLRDRKLWSMGWLQRSEFSDLKERNSGPKCRACKGQGKIQCPSCDGSSMSSSKELQIIDV
ncbi:uncharacterized protein LOC112346931 [Selaginella moellendorffii]|uniref:uncharacterized protein LOC112346931 n=1 Tax=Selaginella moellendorffii TaxID=88036 RepID=UPI000D1C3087|nr:uncharacterized protein LOC112346931 [Selaginella moellendorffii]|eukprot:XP_024532659.1 uncharacterized protein LOC112346931 [Selaginella moellendorffii]